MEVKCTELSPSVRLLCIRCRSLRGQIHFLLKWSNFKAVPRGYLGVFQLHLDIVVSFIEIPIPGKVGQETGLSKAPVATMDSSKTGLI